MSNSGKTKWWVSGIVAPVIAGLIIWYLTGPNSPFRHPPKPGPSPTQVSYGTIAVPSGQSANVYDDPSSSAQVVGTIGNGQTVRITCTIQGQVEEQNGQSSSLWDYVGSGYIPDVNIYTGTTQATMPNC